MPSPEKFDNVSVACKANIYFDGKVVSHAVTFPDGSRKTLVLIYPGEYTFNTGAAERMEIIAGRCRARIAGDPVWAEFSGGTFFEIPANSSFTVSVSEGIAEYVCSFE